MTGDNSDKLALRIASLATAINVIVACGFSIAGLLSPSAILPAGASLSCACRKLNPGISVMESAQDWATKNVPGAIDGARDRCILFQG